MHTKLTSACREKRTEAKFASLSEWSPSRTVPIVLGGKCQAPATLLCAGPVKVVSYIPTALITLGFFPVVRSLRESCMEFQTTVGEFGSTHCLQGPQP